MLKVVEANCILGAFVGTKPVLVAGFSTEKRMKPITHRKVFHEGSSHSCAVGRSTKGRAEGEENRALPLVAEQKVHEAEHITERETFFFDTGD